MTAEQPADAPSAERPALPASARPLRPGEPVEIGPYRLLGRLGEGGMGSVYLAAPPAGSAIGTGPVALKIIRSDFGDDPAFRRRFRSEVARAQQVPPFCTAEVLDADPDHDPPYLVVEYVDGPNLATVVETRGPLTTSNLHALAIGVATALSAIHGAGVIHRDLKPTNVLLAPGSPKVIDFGIARGEETGVGNTATDVVLGTVAYMAPERFDPFGGKALTTAADIFAWGAVVAFAGTGRTPFAAETLEGTAIRIMTTPPDLRGLAEPLLSLVQRALDKEPGNRPTARQLLDSLLSGGEKHSQHVDVALEKQPDLKVAAEGAQAANLEHTLLDRDLPFLTDDGSVPTQYVPGSAVRPSGPTYQPPDGHRPAPARSGSSGVVIGALSVAILVVAATLIGMLSGLIPIGPQKNDQAGPTTPAPGTTTGTSLTTPSGTESSSGPPTHLVFSDSLTAQGRWINSGTADLGCTITAQGLQVVARHPASYRCKGPTDPYTDLDVSLDVQLLTPTSCASIWFRYDDTLGGYALRICIDNLDLLYHQDRKTTPVHNFLLEAKQQVGVSIPVSISVHGTEFNAYIGDKLIGFIRLPAVQSGRLVLGIFEQSDVNDNDFKVLMANIKVSQP